MAEYPETEFLEFVVKSIVDHPEDVECERKIDEMGVLLSLKVNRQDMGQVVGRDGSTAKAIRSLLRIVGVKNNARVNLKILEPEGGKRPERREPRADERPRDNASAEMQEPKIEEPKGAVDKVIEDIKDL
ncbi:MAG: hypothetical protein A3C03_00915 [Candidatus Colwellbacteria bacterium RIFCSPHIGHO2_02_FULL_45_17]|uniref:RNA-binding protein KhpA n=3 Tax=Parcubacteria group TaxID=1794811 RepID=A0A0H4T3Z0_9BACT|nr:hypothetical protein [uncultured Parcubacteria bacterium Rifle_16ft_4_minimus_37647]OGY57611.1 MAG: hypothetical protein A3C03_00915 [Candidatus Colwellbacteria bacterium RIFCSPHIGHO2_02_FULL_45_17]OGY61662.1 MAG: hypothetical protein A3I33_01060 [Candidatus Colwellbacteria bacterium RIFCSPLOWO2_02_FULL_45_11]OGY62758.1 MAG: hypothetical protein A3G58_02425 [Candidatus Colwellbacteria bacterium RIFCSPLOWO2_12_FULL_46_17]